MIPVLLFFTYLSHNDREINSLLHLNVKRFKKLVGWSKMRQLRWYSNTREVFYFRCPFFIDLPVFNAITPRVDCVPAFCNLCQPV